jgi:hypothetical protein
MQLKLVAKTQINLDEDARMSNVVQVLDSGGCDLVASLLLGDDQAFGSKRGQSFAQSCKAGAECQAQCVKLK